MSISIVIPSIGRETLGNALNSVNQEVKDNLRVASFALFLNGAADESTTYSLEKFSNFSTGSSEDLLPPWHSMREALSFSRADYSWLLGDDDLVNRGAIRKILSSIEFYEKSHSSRPNLVILDGVYDDYKGKVDDLVPSLENKSFEIFGPEELLDFLACDLHLLNNGRFLVDSSLLEIWLRQPDTEVETFHEEYRALFLAASELLLSNGTFRILTIRDKLVTLGNVNKSWRKNHDLAVFGEVAMLQLLPDLFGTTRKKLASCHAKERTKIRYLSSLRLAVRGPIKIHPNLKISRYRKAKIVMLNLMPVLQIFQLIHFYRSLKKIFLRAK